MTESQIVQLPVGLVAQFVKHYIGITEVMGSNLFHACIFFRLHFAYNRDEVFHGILIITFVEIPIVYDDSVGTGQ